MPRPIPSLLIACLILPGCAAGPPPTPAPVLIPPAQLTTLEDPDPPPPTSGSLTDLEANHRESMRLYWRLREKFQGLVEWLEQTGSLPSD